MSEKDIDQTVVDEDVQEVMQEEIAAAPTNPQELKERLAEHHSTSPALSGGDIDAEWEDANDSGAESVGGHNPTPGQSDVEANAHAYGVDYQDNEPLEFIEKIEKRDKNRYELNPNSKNTDDSI